MIRATAALLVAMWAWPGLASCPLEAMQAAVGRDEAAVAFQRVLAAGADCSGPQREWAGRVAAVHFITAADTLLRAGGSPRDAFALLQTGLGMGTLWQGLALRGDLRQRIPVTGAGADYAAASEDYQGALNAIKSGDPLLEPVPTAVIETLWNKAAQTRMLAGRAVPSPPTRDGEPGGLAMGSIRSFVPTGVPIPVQFEFNSVKPTLAGAQAAELMAKELEQAGRPPVLLVGHADPQRNTRVSEAADDAYNVALSRRRAEAMRAYLMERGYPAQRVRTDGRGWHEKLPIEDADGYTSDQVNQMLRRIEVRRQ